jgi:hypothetical protein
MRSAKPKPSEPSLRDKLSESFLRAFESDFAANGVDVIQQLRQKSPEKYSEIAAKLIAAVEQPPGPNDYSDCQSMDDIGRKLLRSVGAQEDAITQKMITAAVKANDVFIARLEAIRDGTTQDLYEALAGNPFRG